MTAGGSGLTDRVPRWIWWTVPVVFMTVLYRDALSAWFTADDFAWLGLLRRIYNFHDFLLAMFAPAAQGTIRPWSERGYFLLYETLFGLEALPFRVTAFATLAADLSVLAWVVRKAGGSYAAGCAAAVVWCANTSLSTAMTWSSAWNELLCPLFLLGALALFILWTETGRARFWWSQVAVYLIGFGALETNVVYPALAAAWALLAVPAEKRRGSFLRASCLFPVSVAYFVLHTVVAPLPKTGDYGVRLDARVLGTLRYYLTTSLLPREWTAFQYSPSLGFAILAVVAASLAALLILEVRDGRRAALFGAAWFLITIAPVLVLPGHRTEYYLTIPVAGLGWTLGLGFSGSRYSRLAAAAGTAAYLTGMIPATHAATAWYEKATRPVRSVVLGAQAALEAHPGKAVLLEGIDRNLYTSSIGQGAMFAFGLGDVYLAPGSMADTGARDGVADPATLTPEPEVAFHAVDGNQALVYTLAGDHLRNITPAYAATLSARFPGAASGAPARLDPGNALYGYMLGPGWLKPEDGAVWMTGTSVLRIKGPASSGWSLRLEGSIPGEQLKTGTRTIRASADGIFIGEAKVSDPESQFKRLLPMPDSLVGRSVLKLELQVTPVIRLGGVEYGAVFGTIAVGR